MFRYQPPRWFKTGGWPRFECPGDSVAPSARGKKKTVKVAFVTQPIDPVLPHHRSSIGIWIYEVARRLARSCDVVVYTKTIPGGTSLEYHENVAYRRIPVLENYRLPNYVLSILKRALASRDVRRPLFASGLSYLYYPLGIAWDLRSRRCDIVHILNFSQLVPAIRALNPKIKMVLHMQCEWLTQLDRTMIGRRLRDVDSIVGVSDYITDKIRRTFPEFADRCRTVYNGVDVDVFTRADRGSDGRKEDTKRVLFVGRASPEKGVHVLLDAMRIVSEQYPGVQVQIVGKNKGQCPREFIVDLSDDDRVAGLASFYDGRGYFSHLQEQLRSLNLADNVNFTGAVPHADVLGYYHDADVLVNPSFSESFGMSLVEAMACQVPVVGTRIGGMEEIIEGSDAGLLVEAGDARALAGAVLQLLLRGDLRRSMGRAGRKTAIERFSWDRIAEKTLGHYQNLCENPSPGNRHVAAESYYQETGKGVRGVVD